MSRPPSDFGTLKLFHEALHLAIVANGLAHTLPPCLWDAKLAQFAGMALHQVHRLVQFAGGAMAVGFAALAGTFRNSATKKPLAGDQLGNAGAEITLGCGELGTVEEFDHIWYYILYKIRNESKRKNTMRICSTSEPSLKQQWNQML